MKRRLTRTLVSVALLYSGLVAASLIMCIGTGKVDQFEFPYWQWAVALWWLPVMLHWPFSLKELWQALTGIHSGSDNAVSLHDVVVGLFRHPLVWFVIGGMVWLLVGNILLMYLRGSKPQASLYGDSHWADEKHMAEHHIASQSNPFI